MLWVLIRIASPRRNCLAKAILMSIHNIGFYEDLTKIIFELSSNIIKYAPYFFCCLSSKTTESDQYVQVVIRKDKPFYFKNMGWNM